MGGRGWSVFAKPRGFLRKASVQPRPPKPQFRLDDRYPLSSITNSFLPEETTSFVSCDVAGSP